jgi:hypothetical protein
LEPNEKKNTHKCNNAQKEKKKTSKKERKQSKVARRGVPSIIAQP